VEITNRVDGLKFLAQTHRSIHEERIKRELTVVITTLTFYLVSISLKWSSTIKLPVDHSVFRLCLWGGFLLLAFFVFVYMWGSGRANDFNQTMAEVTEDTLMETLNLSVFEETEKRMNEKPNKKKHRTRGGFHPNQFRWAWLAGVVSLAAIFAAYVITCA